jgi:hypothetical protein
MASQWIRVAYPVNPGNHTFKWVYEKDASGMSGSDCAWVDFITFPPLMTLTCFAGPDNNICSSEEFQCVGEATDWLSVEWTTAGDGSFDDPSKLDPIYTPGSNDLLSGSVELTLSAENTEGNIVSDEMILSIFESPNTPAIPEGPVTVNPEATPLSTYITASVDNASDYIWEFDPPVAGTVSSQMNTAEVSWDESYLGIATIKVKALNDCGESLFSEELEITVDNTVSIKEVSNTNTFTLWPNPNNGSFTIEAAVAEPGNYTIRAYNMLGKTTTQQEGIYIDGSSTINIDFGALPEGLYFLVIEGRNSRMVQKMIINN